MASDLLLGKLPTNTFPKEPEPISCSLLKSCVARARSSKVKRCTPFGTSQCPCSPTPKNHHWASSSEMLTLQEIKFDIVMFTISWICELILILLWTVWEPYCHGPCGSSHVLGQICFADVSTNKTGEMQWDWAQRHLQQLSRLQQPGKSFGKIRIFHLVNGTHLNVDVSISPQSSWSINGLPQGWIPRVYQPQDVLRNNSET